MDGHEASESEKEDGEKEQLSSSEDSLWRSAPGTVELRGNEVHAWHACLSLSPAVLERMKQTLADDELERAKRFVFDKHKLSYVASRGILRDILGRYVHKAPCELEFCYNAFGKPELLAERRLSGLRFNLSHSHGHAIFAFTLGREIGVDIERIRSNVEFERLAERFFSPKEAAGIKALPAHLKNQAFFNCWTRKEAYIKACGEGLSFPLNRFDVTLAPGEDAALAGNMEDPSETKRWTMEALSPAAGYAAALAVERGDWHIERFRWVED